MTEFVGRTGSHRNYSYPETPRRGGSTPYARNFASGPKPDQQINSGLEVPWNAVDAPADIVTPTPDVPITPLSSGVVLISGVVTIHNSSGDPVLVTCTVRLDGSALQPFSATTIPAGDTASIPFLAETDIPVGETHQIEVSLDGDGTVLLADGSVMNVQEVPAATG